MGKGSCLITLFVASTIIHENRAAAQPSAYITNQTFSCGRLGAEIGGYLKAKIFARTLNLPFLLSPFNNSNGLRLHAVETHIPKKHRLRKNAIAVKTIEEVVAAEDKRRVGSTRHPILYVIKHGGRFMEKPLCKEMQEEIRNLIAPIKATPKLKQVADVETVAIHVRTGGGYDPKKTVQASTRRFPPLSFYAKQLQFLASQHANQRLRVHIFTDDARPDHIAKKIKQLVNTHNIVGYDCREKGNRHDRNVLEDLFLMAQCTYLIKPWSSYSGAAIIIGNYKAILTVNNGAFEQR